MTKDNEARVLKALAGCSLFRALKPEQLAQLQKAAELVAFGRRRAGGPRDRAGRQAVEGGTHSTR